MERPDNLVSLMTLYTNPENGNFYVSWSPDVPEVYKAQMRATFGAFVTELDD